MTELLRAEGIHKHYDGVRALVDARFSVLPGEVHALVGENGAGKSTLAQIIAGALRADSGEMAWNGQPVKVSSPADAQRLGIAMIFQELDLFPHLSVAENLVIGNLARERRPWVGFRALDDYCRPYLEAAGLKYNPRTPVHTLPIGHRQLVALARALSLNARLILMDEPTSSLSEDGVDRLFGLVQGLKRSGVSVVFVSHRMREIFRISDRITVLRDGATIGTRVTSETDVDEILAMMAGREVKDAGRQTRRVSAEVLLSVSGLTTARIHDISFELRRGEVLGVAGLVGAGRSELGAALFGMDPWTAGEVRMKGVPIRPRTPGEAMRLGIGLLPEDRKIEGLMMGMTVLENSTMAVAGRFSRAGFVRAGQEREAARQAHHGAALKRPSEDVAVSTLSGGNQQKVLLVKWLLADPEVLFLDDPTRGIDVGAKRDIYQIIERLAAAGKGILLVSSELPELLRCCDRILVLRDGRNAGLLDAKTATQEEILSLATAAHAR
ncbi:MAG: sugar ABC transporter ATP-binding protein [Candidatus Solibacter usitatus]|nr:sugar ABC transporter ATP-binding protein [Candidatus Solibacter usitatus]